MSRVEAEKPHDVLASRKPVELIAWLRLSQWPENGLKTKRVDSADFGLRSKASESGVQMCKSKRRWVSSFRAEGGGRESLFLCLFVPCRSSGDWMVPAHIG